MKRKFHPIQLRYARAKAALELAHEEKRNHLKDMPFNTPAERRAYHDAEDAIDAEMGYMAILNEWIDARQALIDWGKSIALRLASPEQRKELEYLYENAIYHPDIREKLIDTTVRLNAR